MQCNCNSYNSAVSDTVKGDVLQLVGTSSKSDRSFDPKMAGLKYVPSFKEGYGDNESSGSLS